MAQRNGRVGPSLPASLLKQMGDDPSAPFSRHKQHTTVASRKNQRKQHRQQARKGRQTHRDKQKPRRGLHSKTWLGSIASRPRPPIREDETSDSDSGSGVGSASSERLSRVSKPGKHVAEASPNIKAPTEEDDEIAELERKLGISGRKKLPQAFQDEGLGELLGDVEDESETEEVTERRKRKAEADEWLANKRRKALKEQAAANRTTQNEADLIEDDSLSVSHAEWHDEDDRFDEDDEDQSGDSNDDEDDGIPGDLEDPWSNVSDGATATPPPRQKENPYVAPKPAQDAPKYVPPARRKDDGSDAELLSRIRRQTQGYLNRLTEANLVSILADIEKIYQTYPRQHVTSTLADLLLVQVCEPTRLADTLIILIAGFATATYKVIGTDFGAQLVHQVVERFKEYYDQAKDVAAADASKETSNVATLLSELYNFQMIGSKLIFDYVRLFLVDLSELNVELLLRIVRLAGPALRQDDPWALKDIVTLIRPAIAKIGEANLSVRAKFMIETINDLKNNKLKARDRASAVTVQHVTRIRKLLGTLNSRRLKSTEPLRMGLQDFEDAQKKGKWWLVGASWTGKQVDETRRSAADTTRDESSEDNDENDEGSLSSEEGDGLPDLAALARAQGMNTDVRRAIFIAIVAASDCDDAHARLMRLRLNKERQREVASVIMQCVGSEKTYNAYYALIAKRQCSDKRIRYAFQNGLWELLRKLGEAIFGEVDDTAQEDDVYGEEGISLRRLANLGRLFGYLVAHGAQNLSVLKCLDLMYMRSPKVQAFVEVMLVTTFTELHLLKDEASLEPAIMEAFNVDDAPELAMGLEGFLKAHIRKTGLVVKKSEQRAVARCCKMAEMALRRKKEDA